MAKLCPMTGKPSNEIACGACREDLVPVCDFFFLLVAGSRSFDDFALLEKKLDQLLAQKREKDVFLVSGGASGADELAVRYAQKNGFLYREFPVKRSDWEEKGKRAGYLRNRKMHEFIANYDDRGCVLFWDGESPGTRQNIALAEEYNTPLRIVRFEKKGEDNAGNTR